MSAVEEPDWVSPIVTAGDRGPQIGDAWSLSWDGHFEGVIVLSRVFDGHVVGFPITTSAASETEIVGSLHGREVALWPQAETGLGLFLLHRRLGSILTADQISEVRRWAAGVGELSTVQHGQGQKDAAEFADLLNEFRRRCFVEWPSMKEPKLNLEAMQSTPRDFQAITGFATQRVLELWGGAPLTPVEIEAVAENRSSWLTSGQDQIARDLSSPSLKELVIEFTIASGQSEREARNQARESYALAARSASVAQRNTTRAADTLRLLIEESRAT